jgi:hypothetical protein
MVRERSSGIPEAAQVWQRIRITHLKLSFRHVFVKFWSKNRIFYNIFSQNSAAQDVRNVRKDMRAQDDRMKVCE